MLKQPHSNENEGLKKVLVSQLGVAKAIYDLTASQREAVGSEDWDCLKTLLDEKEQRIREFREGEKERERWRSIEEGAALDPSLQTVLSRIDSTLSDIRSLEEENRRLMTKRKKEIGKKLGDIRKVREGIRRFRPLRSGVPRFVDFRK